MKAINKSCVIQNSLSWLTIGHTKILLAEESAKSYVGAAMALASWVDFWALSMKLQNRLLVYVLVYFERYVTFYIASANTQAVLWLVTRVVVLAS
jgi:hypothetical protein